MALQFIYGTSVSKKSEYIYRQMIALSMENPDQNFLILVPEQATLQVQKDLLALHPRRALTNVDVLSFRRLAYRVFDELHQKELNILDDTGKTMILRKVASRKKGELTVFSANLSKIGFIGQLKSMVSEFYQYRVEEEKLEEVLLKLDRAPLLKMKMQNIRTVYQAFQESLANDYITAEELLAVLCRVADQSEYIRKSTIVLDGFTGFTPIQYQLLQVLMTQARHLACVVTIGKEIYPAGEGKRGTPRWGISSQECGLFHMSYQMTETMKALAEQVSCPCKDSYHIFVREEEKRPVMLSFLERNLFRYPMKTYQAETDRNTGQPREEARGDGIGIYQAKNPSEEVAFLIGEVLRLIREEGYEYRDIGVVVGDTALYEPAVTNQMTKAGIPYFIDQKKNLIGNPLVELVRSLLAVIAQSFSYDAMFAWLKNPLSGMERGEVDILETYVIALGISGKKRWQSEWTRTYPGFVKEHLGRINAIRKKAVEPFQFFHQILGGGDDTKKRPSVLPVHQWTEALWRFLDSIHAEEGLHKMAEAFGREHLFHLQKEYEQAYKKVVDLFDQFVSLMGDEELNLQDYTQILEAGFSDIQVGLIPPAVDQLMIGDLMRSRLGNVKALFLLGVNDGILPKKAEEGGLLTDQEREILKSCSLELAPTSREESFTQKYYLYRMLTKPSRRLYMVYSSTDSQGKALRPSYVVGMMRRLYPELSVHMYDRLAMGLSGIMKPENSMDVLVLGMRQTRNGEEAGWWKELYRWYGRHPEYAGRMQGIREGLFYGYHQEELTKAAARRLFGEMPLNSVTRLERFASCAYAHFLIYGLSLAPRVQYRLEAVDYGNIFHKSIEMFFRTMEEEGKVWTQLSVEERVGYVEKSVQKVTEDYGNTIFESSARNQYLAKRLERMTDRTIWALSKQWEMGGFTDSYSEVNFSSNDHLESMELTLAEGLTMALQGRIDRIDVAEKENNVYVKVIDYKSGSTEFDLTKIYHGLQLQLIIYLEAALELSRRRHPEKKIIPAGIYYYNIKDPIVETEHEGEEEAGKAILKELRMNGLSNKDAQALELLDHTGQRRSEVIKNLETKSDGSLSGRSMAADSDQIGRLCRFGTKKAQSLGMEMMRGEIPVSPYSYKQRTPCDVCEFHSVCGFDPRVEGYRYRRLQVLEPDRMWEVLRDLEEKPGKSVDF